MARRPDVIQALRQHPEIQQFLLTDVTLTGKVLGNGYIGSVLEVLHQGTHCAGKKLHNLYIEDQDVIVKKYVEECQLMSSLRHPNITEFLGICFIPGHHLPMMVVEKLDTNLLDLLYNLPNIPVPTKCSIMEDVAHGLLYLHSRKPLLIHKNLNSRSVLLTSGLVAKLTDPGSSPITMMVQDQARRILTQAPGAFVHLAPEGTFYNRPSLDIFSFGHIALFTMTQTFPRDLKPSTYFENEEFRARTEVERREVYIKQLMVVGAEYPALVDLVKQCLHNDPNERPNTEDLLTRLQDIRKKIKGDSKGVAENFKQILAKKDKRREKVQMMQVGREAELEEIRQKVEHTSEEAVANQLNPEVFSRIGDLILYKTNLGSGAFASVHRAEYKHQECAAKMLLQHARDMLIGATGGVVQDAAKQAFEKECSFLQELKHDNIVQHITTAFEPKSQLPILVMELMDCSLKKYISEQAPLALDVQLTICYSVSSGLDYLHSNNIIHRDLCDDNVLLKHSPKLIVKITDFGMSRILDYDSMSATMTAVGHRRGYLPPEGEEIDDEDDDEDKVRYSQHLDIYSFGAVATQTVQSAKHFKTRKKMERTFEQISPDHPLKEIIGRCIHTDSKMRPQAKTVSKDIATILSQNSVCV